MLLLLASGIQMAGPHLTPATFQHALQTTTFPNSYSPLVEGAVGFEGGSFAMTVDAEAMWWSQSAVGPYAGQGAGTWCYAGGRHRISEWRAGPSPLYKGSCVA
jgi:hypothetical protein